MKEWTAERENLKTTVSDPYTPHLTLRPQQTTTMLRTQNVVVEVGYPLTARNSHIQIFYSVVEVHRDAVPEKSWVFINNVCRRRISQLPVFSDFLEFAK
jgi:hypothetical protein